MDCTTSCRLPSHAYAILSAITREDLATFKTVLKRICSNSANLTDRLGRHAIHIAASCGKIEILEWLIEECKVNVELRDQENGWTALHRCLFYGQLNCAEILLQVKLYRKLICNYFIFVLIKYVRYYACSNWLVFISEDYNVYRDMLCIKQIKNIL